MDGHRGTTCWERSHACRITPRLAGNRLCGDLGHDWSSDLGAELSCRIEANREGTPKPTLSPDLLHFAAFTPSVEGNPDVHLVDRAAPIDFPSGSLQLSFRMLAPSGKFHGFPFFAAARA